MKKEFQDVISWYLGVQPIEIDSALVSWQRRKRLYWTNIPWVYKPQDKGIMLKDVLEEDVDEKYYYSEERRNKLVLNPHNHDFLKRTENLEWKCNTLTSITGGNQEKKIAIKQATSQWYILANEWDGISLSYPSSTTRRWRVIHQKSATLTASGDMWVYDKVIRKLTPIECERLQTMPDGYTEWVSDTQRYKMLWNWWTCDVIAHIFSFIPKQ